MWYLPQARICDLITSREAEKPQWAFSLRLVSPFLTLQAAHWGALSPKLCSAAPECAWLALRPRKSPEGHVIRAAGGVTTKHFPRHGKLLMQIRRVRASPVPTPLAPPAAAGASNKLCLYKALGCRNRHPTTTAPLRSIFNISQVRRVKDPHWCGGAASAPPPSPLLENESLALAHHREQALLLHERDGYRRTFKNLWSFARAGRKCEVTKSNREFLQSVIGNFLTPWQVQMLQRETRPQWWPAERAKNREMSAEFPTLKLSQDKKISTITFYINLSNAESVTSVWVRSRWVILGQKLRIWRTWKVWQYRVDIVLKIRCSVPQFKGKVRQHTILLETVELYARTMDLTDGPTAGSRFWIIPFRSLFSRRAVLMAWEPCLPPDTSEQTETDNESQWGNRSQFKVHL